VANAARCAVRRIQQLIQQQPKDEGGAAQHPVRRVLLGQTQAQHAAAVRK
jgi:hypothetical protein